MDYDPFDIVGQKKQREEREKRTALQRQNDEDDIRWLMGQKRGRRFMARMLAMTGVYRTSFTGNSETFFREGMRNIGLILLADVHSLCPEEFVTMLKEHGNDRPSDSSSDRAT